jgi:hypothetical protein
MKDSNIPNVGDCRPASVTKSTHPTPASVPVSELAAAIARELSERFINEPILMDAQMCAEFEAIIARRLAPIVEDGARCGELAKALADTKENGISHFPGFGLRESPPKGQHRTFEMAIMDNFPPMVANQLRQLAEGIEEAHYDPKSPLARPTPPDPAAQEAIALAVESFTARFKESMNRIN